QRPTDRPFRLPAKSLRQLERERGPFTALVIDIEGSEREVFEDSMDLLKRYRLVIAELHEFAIGVEGVERCRQILGGCGLVLVGRAGITEAWERKRMQQRSLPAESRRDSSWGLLDARSATTTRGRSNAEDGCV